MATCVVVPYQYVSNGTSSIVYTYYTDSAGGTNCSIPTQYQYYLYQVGSGNVVYQPAYIEPTTGNWQAPFVQDVQFPYVWATPNSLLTPCGVGSNVYPPPTPEQMEAFRVEEEKRVAKANAAEKKAEELLLMCLPLKQREQYLRDGYLEVNVDTRKYRLRKGWAGNVELLGDDGKPESRFCIHPQIYVPHADNILSQKLMLETNETEFLRIANRTRLR